MPGISEDIELNTGVLHSQELIGADEDEFGEEECEPDAITPMVYGPVQPQRRQEWEFKHPHIEFMVLGICALEFS